MNEEELKQELNRLRNDDSIKRMDESFEYTAYYYELKGRVDSRLDTLKEVKDMINECELCYNCLKKLKIELRKLKKEKVKDE